MKKILIVDNEASIQEVVSVILGMHGYETIVLSGGEDIVSLLLQIPVHLILLDVYLPGKDGIAICKELKSDERFAHIPVILFSAGSKIFTPPVIQICDGYLEKPFDMDELVKTVSDHVL